MPMIMENHCPPEVAMSLQGSLETVGIPDVLQLLANTAKSGELDVSSVRRGGRLWFVGGKLSGFDVGRAPAAVDAVFELLRVTSGTFSFDESRSARDPGKPVAVAPILAEATARLSEWREIEAVVPSLEMMLELVAEPAGDVVLTAEQWKLVVSIGDGHPVGVVLERRKLGEFDGCKAVKGLIDAGLARVVAKPVAPSRPLVANRPSRRPAGEGPASLARVGATGAVDDDVPGAAHTRPALADAAVAAAAESVVATETNGARSGVTLARREPAGGGTGAPAHLKRPDKRSAATAEPTEQSPSVPVPSVPLAVGRATSDDAHASADEPSPPEPDAEGDEPLNRGLLLKFLSSVRS
ncbi:MAG TPA: DUF4388 domain-containing protein [Acidimicrobiales bacterium]|jgi:hypothetical protein|nr:DUF4388 domain-containing protein [Acidimicrobiales bacterium]